MAPKRPSLRSACSYRTPLLLFGGLRSLRNAVTIDDSLVRLVAEPWSLGYRDGAIRIYIDAVAPKTCGAVHKKHFDKTGIVAQRHKLQCGQKSRPEIGGVWRELDAHFIRQRSHFQIFANAAALGNRGLCIAHGAHGHHLAELMNRTSILSRRNIN